MLISREETLLLEELPLLRKELRRAVKKELSATHPTTQLGIQTTTGPLQELN